MLNVLFFISNIKPYAFWGLVILGLIGFVIYAMVLDRKTNRHRQSKLRNRCKAEKTKYYD